MEFKLNPNGTCILNYNKVEKIIEKYYSSIGKKVNAKISSQIIFNELDVIKTRVDVVISINEKNSLLGIKSCSYYLLSIEELKKIISSILEENGKELILFTSDVELFKDTIFKINKTFTITFKEKTIQDIEDEIRFRDGEVIEQRNSKSIHKN